MRGRWGGVLASGVASALLVASTLVWTPVGHAVVCTGTSCTVTSATDLVTALTTVDNNPTLSYTLSYTITITGPITLSSSTTLPAINMTSGSVTINRVISPEMSPIFQ